MGSPLAGPLAGEDEQHPRRKKRNAASAASAASMRAITGQVVSFYFRAPIKAFFRTRIDYLAYARAINPWIQRKERWSWKVTTPGILAYAVKEHGWGFLPNQVLPPLLANVTVGAVLYTAYLQTLSTFHDETAMTSKRAYPPPPMSATFAAGLSAGAIQSLVAAPLDALQVRFQTTDMLEAGGRYNMWQYGFSKLREIGIRGVFAGWGLSFVKDSIGYGLFFCTFETIKSQAFYSFVTRYYGDYRPIFTDYPKISAESEEREARAIIKPHFAMEPTFLLLAGATASVAQQTILHPTQRIQDVHYGRLEAIDFAARDSPSRKEMMKLYSAAYKATFLQCKMQVKKAGTWRQWLYKGFIWNTLRQIPSTSAGLIVFELVRRKYATDADTIRIEKDGYDILLS